MGIDDPVEKQVEVIRSEMTERDRYFSAAVTALLSQIPLLGPYLDSVLREQRQQRLIERLTDLCSLLADEMNRLDKKKINLDATKSEEFQSILLTVLRNLETTDEREKLRYFKNILLNSIRAEMANSEHKKLFLNLIRDLSVPHVIALERICKKYPVSAIAKIGEIQAMFPEWDGDVTRRICNDLARYWLLAEVLGYASDAGDQYRVTRYATEFLRFILDEGEGPNPPETSVSK